MIFVGNKGTKFIVTIREGGSIVDLSTAASVKLIFKRPGGPNIVVDADLETDGTDGRIFFIIGSDWSWSAGTWVLQAFLDLPGGVQYSETDSFIVKDPL